ncbi:hypothetical protein GCM10027062_21260 [Nocardioides hungaricus]
MTVPTTTPRDLVRRYLADPTLASLAEVRRAVRSAPGFDAGLVVGPLLEQGRYDQALARLQRLMPGALLNPSTHTALAAAVLESILSTGDGTPRPALVGAPGRRRVRRPPALRRRSRRQSVERAAAATSTTTGARTAARSGSTSPGSSRPADVTAEEPAPTTPRRTTMRARSRRAVATAAVLAAALLGGCADDQPSATSGPDDGAVADIPGGAVLPDRLSVSEDGSQVLADCREGSCRWDTADGALASVEDGSHLAIAPDWTLVAGGDATDGSAVQAVAFSPDGRLVAAAGPGGRVLVWTVEGDEVATIDAGAEVFALAFSPDGTRLATAGGGPAEVYDVPSGERVGALPRSSGEGDGLAWSPDGRWLAAPGPAGAPAVWSADGLRLEAVLDGRLLEQAAFSPDSRTLAVTDTRDDTVRLWDPRTGRVRELTGHTDDPVAVAFAPDGRTPYSASARDGVLAWTRRARGSARSSSCRSRSDREPVGPLLDQLGRRAQPPRLEDQLGQLVALDPLEADDDPAEAVRRELHLEDVRPLPHERELLGDRLLQPDRHRRLPEVAEPLPDHVELRPARPVGPLHTRQLRDQVEEGVDAGHGPILAHGTDSRPAV